jgi:O-antigen/teichoic acid export membrane protein
LIGRAGWAVIDQGFVSLANFGLGVIVARLVSPTEFGAFGVAFAIYLVALNVSRGFATQPLTIRFAGREPAEFRRGVGEATGVAFGVGVLGAAVCLAIAALLGGVLGVALAALSVSLPGLLVQDAWRFVLFTSRRGRVAIVNDLVATLVMATLIALVVLLGAVSVFTIMVCWGAGGTAAAMVGILQTGVRPLPNRAIGWWREHIDITPRFLGSELIQMGGAQLVLFALGALIGLAAVGSVRGAQLLLGPIYVLSIGVHLSMIPEAARMTGSIARLRRIVVLSSTALTVAGTGWGLALLLLPDSIGRQLLGESWPGARSVLLPIALSIIIPLATAGPRIGLGALQEATRTLRAGLVQFALVIVGGVSGAVIDGTVGAAWGLAIGMCLAGIAWWFEVLRAIRHQSARIDAGEPTVLQGRYGDEPILDPETLSQANP